jgi:hypothetical protein
MTMSLSQHASQATQIEQARAVAEVAAAIRYAQDNPRDEDRALALFERSCNRLDFAQRAFFRYSRGGQQVTGVTIAFAQEAARCWQNMSSGSAELARRARESEMVAFAWDLEMNTQRRTTFVNPHTGYTDTPREDKPARELVAVRDIRENNQSAGSRVEREMILAVLPTWYVEKGKAWCHATVGRQGGDKPIEDRRREIIKTFEGIGVRRDELIAKLGVPVDQWIEADLATLIVIGQSIRNGETTIENEFRTGLAERAPTVTAAALAGASARPTRPAQPQSSAAAGAPPAAAPAAAVPSPPGPPLHGEDEPPIADKASPKQTRHMHALFREGDVTDRTERLKVTGLLLDRDLDTSADLTSEDADAVIAALLELKGSGHADGLAGAINDLLNLAALREAETTTEAAPTAETGAQL